MRGCRWRLWLCWEQAAPRLVAASTSGSMLRPRDQGRGHCTPDYDGQSGEGMAGHAAIGVVHSSGVGGAGGRDGVAVGRRGG